MWLTEWTKRWPSISSDEFFWMTLVFPFPWTKRQDEDGDLAYTALVVRVLPWWLSEAWWDREVRVYIRRERAFHKLLYKYAPDPDDAEWDKKYDAAWTLVGPPPARIPIRWWP